jgi:hypothetical protein
MHGAITLPWGDGDHAFRLGLDDLEALEEKCGRSIFAIAERLHASSRAATTLEIREVLRLGLIGGGAGMTDALFKVRKFVDARPLDESRDTAYAVALAALARVHSSEMESPSGEADAARPTGSTSPPSTEAPSSWASTTSGVSPSANGSPSAGSGTKRTAAVKPRRRAKTSSSKRS